MVAGSSQPKGAGASRCFVNIRMSVALFEPERRKKPTKVLDIELIKYNEIERVRAFKSPQECQNVNELKLYAQVHGYKPGWVYYQQKSRGWLMGRKKQKQNAILASIGIVSGTSAPLTGAVRSGRTAHSGRHRLRSKRAETKTKTISGTFEGEIIYHARVDERGDRIKSGSEGWINLIENLWNGDGGRRPSLVFFTGLS